MGNDDDVKSRSPIERASSISRWLGGIKILFTALVFFWPALLFMSLFMYDSPSAGGVSVSALVWSTLLYGPAYFSALLVARSQTKRGNSLGALKTWLLLCGTDVVVWVLAFTWIATVCDGRFSSS